MQDANADTAVIVDVGVPRHHLVEGHLIGRASVRCMSQWATGNEWPLAGHGVASLVVRD